MITEKGSTLKSEQSLCPKRYNPLINLKNNSHARLPDPLKKLGAKLFTKQVSESHKLQSRHSNS